MRTILFCMMMLVLPCTFQVWAQQTARIVVDNRSGGNVYLQPEDTTGYHKMPEGKAIREIALDGPCYYCLTDKDFGFHALFVTPGAQITVVCKPDSVQISGTNEAENRFMQTHAFICRAPEGVAPYSREWLEYNGGRLKDLCAELDNSGLSEDFIAAHKLYWEYTYLYQRLNGMEVAQVFRPAEGTAPLRLPDGYYDFLQTVTFDDERVLWLPKWFRTMDKVFEEQEKHGVMPVSNDNYLTHYARGIGNDKLRSRYLVAKLELMLKKGYLKDFAGQLEQVRPFITEPAARERLPELEQVCTDLCERNAHVAPGRDMPSFEAQTVDGRTYRLEDFKGSLVVLDFWFTGCVPCKAEMPYLERLAGEMNGRDIRFVSVSLDTGNQLMAAWRKMMEGKEASPVLHLNLPGGFKSDFMKTLNITSVPRMLLLDREGWIVEAYAKRPSDPKLKQQIEQLLAE